MAPKAKRGTKAAATKDIAQENVVDSTWKDDVTATAKGLSNGSEKSPEQPNKKKTTKRGAATIAKENAEEVPAKRGRGKPKSSEAQTEPAPEPPKVTKGKRGATKKTDAQEELVVEKTAQHEASGTGRGKGRGKAAVSKEEPIPAVDVEKNGSSKRGRGRGKATEPAPEAEATKLAEPKSTKRGGSKKTKEAKEIATANGVETDEKNEVEPQAAAPKKGRARKTAAAKEETAQPVVEKPVDKPKRGRKAKEVVAEEEPVENGDNKPIKKGTKRAAPASSSTAATKASKKIAEERITDGKDDNVPEDDEQDGDHQEVITAKKSKATSKKPPTKAAVKALPASTDYSAIDFSFDKDYNMKICSWNVAGLRAWLKKSGADYIKHEQPDIICLQEIKCIPDDIPDEARFPGYHPYWLCKPGGHAGVAIYSKIMPINVEYGIGDSEQDDEGRILTAEFEKFFLICVYVPNAGRKLVTLPKRLRWNKLFEEFVKKLNAKKPVIICGDMNVAHNEIDLTNPKPNKNNAGFTMQERNGMTDLLSLGFVDTYRHFYPNQERAYTFWAYFMNARAKDVGWRLDYFIVSERLLSKCVDNVIRSKVMGSDHCPITLFLNV